ncbi:LOW QUALITY PROTEIN: hypothetical protein HID58_087132 [Brassica napus]|uniref:Uncharacterized protein n=1 Tax=Brassica napus TaxID=3708 RepID=A0ABQ7XSG1_BRANA|nr:LOW QUALITY PROTEIN: hypothetical protein HID58_087132 [Brassica napus]
MKARRKVIPTLMVAYLLGADCNLRVAKNQWQSSTNVSTFFIRHGNYCSPQTTCPKDLLRYQESTRLSPGTKTNMLNVPPAKSQAFTSSRVASKASRIEYEDSPQFRPPGLIKPPHPPNPQPRQDSPSQNSWELHKHLGYEKKHHPLCRRSRLLHQTSGQLRPIPTMGQHLILIKDKKKVLQAQLDPVRQ